MTLCLVRHALRATRPKYQDGHLKPSGHAPQLAEREVSARSFFAQGDICHIDCDNGCCKLALQQIRFRMPLLRTGSSCRYVIASFASNNKLGASDDSSPWPACSIIRSGRLPIALRHRKAKPLTSALSFCGSRSPCWANCTIRSAIAVRVSSSSNVLPLFWRAAHVSSRTL
jgi:hypothetical protein